MKVIASQWWVASLGDTLVWARLDLLEAGTACVLDCDGRVLPFDSEDSARAALLDAEFRAWDGLDEADAAELGLDLAVDRPPVGEDPASLRAQMVVKRQGRTSR